ncbi:MAG: hypothetical protein QGG36_20630 [Pirellulaceae bacterium]|jgi:hypothetical protein|nr:hypothetical protein [Pirellulaceae bacterium]MDP7018223.1 hypothetical protein [Pirellulaceae bacterium]
MKRQIQFDYQDPLELIWIRAAAKMGMEVARDDTVFASWDGEGTLRIGTPETLDKDDSVAQMVFHEICHALVEGPDAFPRPDWGLDISNRAQRVREHACLRLQAALADQFQLRRFLAATTDFRAYYDRIPAEPLAGQGDDDPAIPLAAVGWERAQQGPWAQPLDSALRSTAAIAKIVAGHAHATSLWRQADAE